MGRDTYLVAPADDGWSVRLGQKMLGTFEAKTDAIRAAVQAAQLSDAMGVQADVLTQASGGETHKIWETGKDALSSD